MSEPIKTGVKVEIPSEYSEGHLRWLDKEGNLWVQKREKLSPEEKARRESKRKDVARKLSSESSKLRNAISVARKNDRKLMTDASREAYKRALDAYEAFKAGKKEKRKQLLA